MSTGNYTDEAYKFYHANGNFYGKFPTEWTIAATAQAAGDKFEMDINVNGVVTAKRNGLVVKTFNGEATDYNFGDFLSNGFKESLTLIFINFNLSK